MAENPRQWSAVF